MTKEIRCADVGMDCDFVARASTTEEVLERVVTHAEEKHGITEITPDMHAKVQSVIRDVPEA